MKNILISQRKEYMSRDWTGSRYSGVLTNGVQKDINNDRQKHDYYATDPQAIPPLIERETFSDTVWECACGELHLSNALGKHGYKVINTDLIVRGGGMEQLDFLKYTPTTLNKYDIITNPPYKYARQFVEHAIEISKQGVKIAMFLKLTFLESKSRYKLFAENPPKKLYVFSTRMKCAKNGDFANQPNSAVAYGWYVWEVGWKGEPGIGWIKPKSENEIDYVAER